ncbi:MAG: recombinase family protein, partial [Bryobacteraceae bacterium]
GYVRVSTDRQADLGVSLEAQEAKIRAMATVRGVALEEVIVDGGESAKDLNRPGVRQSSLWVTGYLGSPRPRQGQSGLTGLIPRSKANAAPGGKPEAAVGSTLGRRAILPPCRSVGRRRS